MDFKKEVVKLIAKETNLKDTDSLIETPPDPNMGDYAFPCFALSKTFKKDPKSIAQELASKLKPNKYVQKVENKGPYLNFFVNKKLFTQEVIQAVLQQKECYGSQKAKKETILVESPGPNSNKPLHLGHLRNLFLGQSLINILKFGGYKVKHVDIVNDRGVHICKAMLAYQRWGKNKKPDIKPDHFVGKYYVLYQQKVSKHPEMEQEIQEMLAKWEQKDPETRKLWKKICDWVHKGFQQTFKRLGLKIDKVYYESEHYEKGKTMVKEALKKGIFYKTDNGAIAADLSKYDLGEKILLREDGTSVYATQDLSLAIQRHKDFKMDRMIYVVGNEQIYHFKVVFKLLELLNVKFAQKCYHLSHGMVGLPEGKMKSREGKIVDADDLLDTMENMAKQEVNKRYKNLSKQDIQKRSISIAHAALRFFILKYDPAKDFVYNPEESISFEGETGPYVQYAHARICSILKKHGKTVNEKVDYAQLSDPLEQALAKQIQKFPEIAQEAANSYKPSLLTRYLLDIAQLFNEYYHAIPILKSEPEVMKARLVLIKSTKQTLKNGLSLLSIEAPEAM